VIYLMSDSNEDPTETELLGRRLFIQHWDAIVCTMRSLHAHALLLIDWDKDVLHVIGRLNINSWIIGDIDELSPRRGVGNSTCVILG
jgi:hypothetical protein